MPSLKGTWAYRIVRASRRVTPLAKLLYELLLELDNPDEHKGRPGGCYMAEVELARQLGASADHVSDLRTHLLRFGLVHREHVAGSRVDWWFPILPPAIEPTPPQAIEALPTKQRTDARRAWLAAQAVALDNSMEQQEQTVASPIIRGRQRHSMERRIPPSRPPLTPTRQRRISPSDGGGIHPPQPGVDGGGSQAQRRIPPLSEDELSESRRASESLESMGHNSEQLTESDTAPSRSEHSQSDARAALDPETKRLMDHYLRRRAEAAVEEQP